MDMRCLTVGCAKASSFSVEVGAIPRKQFRGMAGSIRGSGPFESP